jgi:hypothetical protein
MAVRDFQLHLLENTENDDICSNGSVTLGKAYTDTGLLYAIKTLGKALIIAEDKTKQVYND